MPNAKEIKSRIASVKDTAKITNAMYLISSTKLRKAKRELEKTRPYFNALQTEIKRIFRTAGELRSRYFYPPEGEPVLNGTFAMLVITADKGLAGSYNQNVIKEAERRLSIHPDTKLFVVGEYGRHYFMSHNIPIEQSFLYTAQNPTMMRARDIMSQLLYRYDRGEIEKIYIVYTDMKNGVETEVISERLLPFHRKEFASPKVEKEITSPFEFHPDIESILNGIMPSYIAGYIYSALVDSFCSEQNSRMNAMDSANRNAEELIEKLKIDYNRVRQAAITQEITEISAGAKAQKRKRMREEAGV